MLTSIFHYYNRSQPHKFITVLATYGLSLPFFLLARWIYPHFMHCFTWNRVLISRNWVSASWRGQFGCQDSGVMTLMSTPMSSNSSITKLFIHTLSFYCWSFIEVWQNIHFLFPTGIFDSYYMSPLSSRTVWLFSEGTGSFNFISETCSSQWLWMTGPCLT